MLQQVGPAARIGSSPRAGLPWKSQPTVLGGPRRRTGGSAPGAQRPGSGGQALGEATPLGSSPQMRKLVPHRANPFPGHRPSPLPGREPPALRLRSALARARSPARPPSQRALGCPTTRESHARDKASCASPPPRAGSLRRHPRFNARRGSGLRNLRTQRRRRR